MLHVTVIKYRNREIVMELSPESLKWHASWKHLGSQFASDSEEAIAQVQVKIDAFLESSPKTYAELSDALEESLIWTGYESCHLSPETVEVLVENFLIARETILS